MSQHAVRFADQASPISMIGTTPLVLLLAHPSLKVRTVQEISPPPRQGRARSTTAPSGNGTILHLAEMVSCWPRARASNCSRMPYRGAGQFLQDLVAGQIQLDVFGINGVRARSRWAPGRPRLTPTAHGAARTCPPSPSRMFLDYEIEGWFLRRSGRRARLPAAAVDPGINAAFRAALEDPAVRDALVKQGNAVTPSTPGAGARNCCGGGGGEGLRQACRAGGHQASNDRS